MIAYFNGQFMQKDEVRISPDDRGFLFADGVYEVIRVYNGKLFRAEDHLERMTRSLGELRIRGVNVPEFRDISEELIRENHLDKEGAVVYIQITRGATFPRKHVFPEEDTPPTLYAFAAPFASPLQQWEEGVKIILVSDIRWTRCDIKTVSLLPNALGNQQAKENGAAEAVFVRDGVITEGSHTNFAAVSEGQLLTFPECNYILPGITRKVVLELCGELDIPVREFPVFEKDLKNADECMILGTTTEVMPVVQVDDRMVGDGKPGQITMKLHHAFRRLVS